MLKFKVRKSSESYSSTKVVDISSLEELLKFVEDAKKDVILSKDEDDWGLEIYDCYIE